MRIFGIKISLIFICINFFSYYLFGQFTSCPCNKTTCGDVIASFKIDGDLTRICDGSEFTVINNTTTPGIDYYIWDWGDGSRDSVLTNANIKHKYQIPANQVCLDKESLYVICLRAVKKCSSGISCHSNSSPVSVIHRPFADFSLSNLELCVGQKLSFTNKSCNVDESLLDAYLWEFSDGTTATDKSPNKSLSNPGKYDISLKVKNQCGEHRVTKTVNVVDYPNIIVDVSNNAKDTVVCLGEIVSFVNRSNQWSNINWILPTNNYFRDTSNWKILYKYRVKDLQTVGKQDSVPFLDSIVFQVLKSGVYRFEMRSMNVCSTLVWRLNLKVEDGPIYQINKPSVYCETAIYTPIINLTSGSIKSVEWAFPGGNPSVSNQFNPGNVSYNAPGTYDITVKLFASCDTIVETFKLVVNSREPVKIINPNKVYCQGSAPDTLKASRTGGQWSGNGIVNSSLGIFDPTKVQPGKHNISYTIGPSSCSSMDMIVIEVIQSAVVNAQDRVICENSALIQLVASPTGGSWSGNNAVTSSGVFDPGLAKVGNNVVNYTLTDSNGCNVVKSINVLVESLPILNSIDTVEVCEGSNNLDIKTVFNLSTNSNGGNFKFYLNNAEINSPMDISAFNLGIYLIQVKYKKNECEVQKDIFIKVISKQLLIISNDTTICKNNLTLELVANLKGGIWEGPGIDPTTGIIDLSKGQSGIYKYIFQKATSCEQVKQVKVVIIDPGQGLNAGQDEVICNQQQAFYSLNTPSPSGGKWYGFGLDSLTGVVDLTVLKADTFYTFTYCVSSSSSNNCNACDSKKFMLKSRPKAMMDLSGLTCIGEDIIIVNKSNGIQRHVFDLGDNSTSILDSFNYQYTKKGTYNLQLIVFDQYGCSDTLQQSIYVTTRPMVSFTLSSKEGCAPFVLSSNNMSSGDSISYRWIINTDSFLTKEIPNVKLDRITKDSLFIIRLDVSNQCGIVSAFDTVLVHPYPISTIGVTNESGCSPLVVNFANKTLGNPDNFLWDLGNGVVTSDSIPAEQIYFAKNDSVTNYLITLISNNECGSDTTEKEIKVYPPDVKAFIESPGLPICQFDSVRLLAHSTHGAINTWKLIAPDGSLIGASGDTAIIQLIQVGKYKIILYASRCGSDTDTSEIEVLEAPSIDFNLPNYACLGDSIFFENVSKNIAGSIWDFGDGQIKSSHDGIHIYSQPGKYKIRLTGYSLVNNCPFYKEKEIIIIGLPLSSFEPLPSQGCVPLTINIKNNSTSGVKYEWNFGDGASISNLTNPVHIYDKPGTFTLALRVYDNFGCYTDTSYQNILVHPKPKSDFDYLNKIYCHLNDSISFINKSEGNSAWRWIIENQEFTQKDLIYFPNDSGKITARLISSSNFGCLDSIEKEVYINPSPISNFQTDKNEGCESLTIHFDNLSLNSQRFIWDFGNGNTSIDVKPEYTYVKDGKYKINLIALSNNGCPSDTSEKIIEVFPKPNADFVAIKDSICGVPVRVELKNNSTLNVDNSWYINNQKLSQDVDYEHTFNVVGSHTVSLSVQSDKGCIDSLSQTIEAYPKPIAAFVIDDKLCQGDIIVLENESKNALNYTWHIDGIGVSNEFEPEISFKNTGQYNIKLIAEYNAECQDSIMTIFPIKVYKNAIADFDYKATYNNNVIGEVAFENLSMNYNRVKWNLGNGEMSEELNPEVEYDINRNIYVTLFAFNDNNGEFTCVDSIVKPVAPEWITTFYAPNAMSPEYGSGLVKLFKPVGVGLVDYKIRIFSPWGEEVWNSEALKDNSPSDYWDGTYKGSIVPQGSYSWLAEIEFVNGIKKIVKGSVTVLR